MAIRLGPPPGLARLRLQWHATRSQFLRQSRIWNDQALTWRGEARAWWQRVVLAKLPRLSLRERALQRQRARQLTQLADFSVHYEDMVDLLCWAAKEGANVEQSRKYSEMRVWMQAHYGLMRPRLRSFLETPDDQFDPFECLFVPRNLEDVINDMSAIENVMLTRSALDAYRETLEQPQER